MSTTVSQRIVEVQRLLRSPCQTNLGTSLNIPHNHHTTTTNDSPQRLAVDRGDRLQPLDVRGLRAQRVPGPVIRLPPPAQRRRGRLHPERGPAAQDLRVRRRGHRPLHRVPAGYRRRHARARLPQPLAGLHALPRHRGGGGRQQHHRRRRRRCPRPALGRGGAAGAGGGQLPWDRRHAHGARPGRRPGVARRGDAGAHQGRSEGGAGARAAAAQGGARQGQRGRNERDADCHHGAVRYVCLCMNACSGPRLHAPNPTNKVC